MVEQKPMRVLLQPADGYRYNGLLSHDLHTRGMPATHPRGAATG